jgi:hypothetical protein
MSWYYPPSKTKTGVVEQLLFIEWTGLESQVLTRLKYTYLAKYLAKLL